MEKQNQKTPQKNRLSKEKSPYLFQHANNPVDWYPWGMRHLKKRARKTNLFSYPLDIPHVIGVM